MHYPIIALMHGSHGLSARRAWRTLSSKPKVGPKGRSLEVGARKAPRLLVYICCFCGGKIQRSGLVEPEVFFEKSRRLLPLVAVWTTEPISLNLTTHLGKASKARFNALKATLIQALAPTFLSLNYEPTRLTVLVRVPKKGPRDMFRFSWLVVFWIFSQTDI